MMCSMPRSEYPRPQFRRDKWMNLNGEWQFEIDAGDSGREQKWQDRPALSERILAPFCPESRLSGIAHTDFIRACWYRREIDLDPSWTQGRVLLHFGAVNYETTVWVNGIKIGMHEGGYASFTLDITRAVHEGTNVLVIQARSDVRAGRQPSGKQSPRYGSFGCFYTRTTGIWQTVWLENVPEKYLERIQWIPDPENACFHMAAEVTEGTRGELRIRASFAGKEMGEARFRVSGRSIHGSIPLAEKHLWSVEDPALYDLEAVMETDTGTDRMESYAGLRSVTWDEQGFKLNGKPVFMRLVLDQGFNPEGIITAPSDGELKNDILRSKAMGFNGARLHQKMFEARFLYWADTLGYLVWDEHGNWGMDVSDGRNMPRFLSEWTELVRRDLSSPAVIGWCPFNETERDTDPANMRIAYRATRAMDSTRPIIDTSGWVHCEETDFMDYHDYTQSGETLKEHLEKYVASSPGEAFPAGEMDWLKAWRLDMPVNHGQPVFLSEFGGIGWIVGGVPRERWGYGDLPETEEAFIQRFESLVTAALTTRGLCGFCYTQLTDVEQEINGLYTYDRQPKFPPEKVSAIMTRRAWNEVV